MFPNRSVTFALCSALIGGTAQAGSKICAQINGLVPLAQANFTWSGAEAQPAPMAGAQSCTMARALSGARSFHCAWVHPYRATEARDGFEVMTLDLGTCLARVGAAEPGVNHPDSYELRSYLAGDVTVNVSLKDKGALGQTLVFVGVEGVVP